MATRALRHIGKKAFFAAANHFGPGMLEGLGRSAGKALGLTPTEHREQLETAVGASVSAAEDARSSLARGECANAYEQASRSRAFATVAAVEAKNAGAGVKQMDSARRAIAAASKASRAVRAECEVVPRSGRDLRDRRAETQRELPAAPMSGIRRRRSSKSKR